MKIGSNLKGLPQFDWLLFLCYLALVIVGLMMIYTTTFHDYTGNIWSISSPFGKQVVWAGVSIVLLFMVYVVDWQFWNTISIPLYIIGLLGLVAVLILGSEIKGATSWISLGPFTIQPSEFAKLSTAIYVSSLLSAIRFNLRDIKTQLLIIGLIAAPIFLIILQPDPGSALTFLSLSLLLYRRGMPTLYYVIGIMIFLTLVLSLTYGYQLAFGIVVLIGLLFVVDFKKNRLFSIMLLITLVLTNIISYQSNLIFYGALLNILVFLFVLFYFNRRRSVSTKFSFVGGIFLFGLISFASSYAFNNLLKPHQQDRINVWLQPEKCDPRGSLYNLIQSKLAIGSGGVTGKGYLEGTYTKLNYVPEQTTDFIFSSIGEEQGFIGGTAVIVLFMIMVLRIIQKGEDSKHQFIKNYSYAIAGFIFIHFFINIGMTMGISPVIGIPLPFISKGGSSLMSFSLMIGIALKMYKSR